MCRFLTPQIIFIFIVACVGRILYAGVEQAGATDSFAVQLVDSLKQFNMTEKQQNKLSTLTGIVDNCKTNAEIDEKFKLFVFKNSEKDIMEFGDKLVSANHYEEQAKYCFVIINRCPLVLLPDHFKGASVVNYMQLKASEKEHPINLGKPTGDGDTETVNEALQILCMENIPGLLKEFLDQINRHTLSTVKASIAFDKIIGAIEAAAKELIGNQSDAEPCADNNSDDCNKLEQIGKQSEVEPCAEVLGEISDVEPCADSYGAQVMYLLNLVQMNEEQRTTISTLRDNFDKYRTKTNLNDSILATAGLLVEGNVEGIAKRAFKMINRYPLVFLPANFDPFVSADSILLYSYMKISRSINSLKREALEKENPKNLGEPTRDDSANCLTLTEKFFNGEGRRCMINSEISKNISLIIQYINELEKDPNTTDPQKIKSILP